MRTNIFCIGDIVGRPGRDALKRHLPSFLKDNQVDFCVANAENIAGGSGITPDLLVDLFSSGVDCVTTGDHVWKKKEIIPHLEKDQRIIRPANYPKMSAGKGHTILTSRSGSPVCVINLQGRVFMKPIDCPFLAVNDILDNLPADKKIIVCDFHAEATSEKIAMGWHLDGKVSIVFGTHTHIQTADERVLPKGTAYITDVGMTGPYDSVIGRQTDRVLSSLITGMPSVFDVATGDVRICGVLVAIDSSTGLASSVKRISHPA